MAVYENKWFFPNLGGGEEQGLNEPGVETFKKGGSLGRETIQNVGDARDPKAIEAGEPAIAEFELLPMPVAEMPGHEELLEIFRACEGHVTARFEKEKDRQANGLPLLERAISLLEGDTIPVLRIRDRNTTGLLGTDADSDANTPYWRLIRNQGYSSREGVGGGTYGIGQRAPFAFSDLRVILYYTRTSSEEEAFIGKSVLCSFPHPTHGKMTQNKGWFCRMESGDDEDWAAVRKPDAIPTYFRRADPTDVGTDLYVTGYRHHPNWKKELRRAVLRHFFGAIQQGFLEVRITDDEGNQTISADTIVDVVAGEAGF